LETPIEVHDLNTTEFLFVGLTDIVTILSMVYNLWHWTWHNFWWCL